jgi:hypothetical protein
MRLKLDSNPWFQCLPCRQWATARLLELLYERGLAAVSERCCHVYINMTGHKRKQGNEHNFFFLFSVGVTRGTLFALQTQSPPPDPLPFFFLLLCQTCCSIGRGILNSFLKDVISLLFRLKRPFLCPVVTCSAPCDGPGNAHNYGNSISGAHAEHMRLCLIPWLPSYKSRA